MKLLKKLILTLVMIYALVSSQVTATDEKEPGGQPSSLTRQNLTEGQNEGATLKKGAIKFYAQNYGAITFLTITVPLAAYGIYNLVNYVDELQQQQRERYNQQIALYHQQREVFINSCELSAKQCNGTWIPIESCSSDLAKSTCYKVLFDCVSKLCGWTLFLARNPDNTLAQILVNFSYGS